MYNCRSPSSLPKIEGIIVIVRISEETTPKIVPIIESGKIPNKIIVN